MFKELMEGVDAMKTQRLKGWAWWREGFNPRVGPMQPVNEGEHAMVAIEDPILGSNKSIDEGD